MRIARSSESSPVSAGQKGFDLLADIAPELAELDLAFAILGSGEPRYERMFRELANSYPEKVAVRVGYDDGLAHRIEAGADMFLMPSRYEPCGLSQMYSLRYGTVPIVRATGGLEDTIDETTGFKFVEYTPEALLDGISEALAAWQDTEAWTAKMRHGMAKNFSWEASAAGYQRSLSQPYIRTGLNQRKPGNRAKSVSVDTSSAWYSIAKAAR